MKRMPASAFKKHCLRVIREIQSTGEPVTVTKSGIAIVKVIPIETEDSQLFGFMAGEMKIVGDIEFPLTPWRTQKNARKRSFGTAKNLKRDRN